METTPVPAPIPATTPPEATSSFAPQPSGPPPVPSTGFAPTSGQIPPTPSAPSPVPTPTERIAPEPARVHAATNPVLAMLVGGVLACALLGGGIILGRATKGGDGMGGVMGSGGVNAESGNAITAAVKQIGPAVMNVDTTFGTPTTADYLPRPGQGGGDGPRQGKGTGFIIDSKKGLMLTNAHVVAGAKRIQVTTRDGQKIPGRVLGFDRRSDIAVVSVENKKLPQAVLAPFKDAKTLDIGQWTIAIGNPYAQENTVTVGVLSAVGRKLPVPRNEEGEAFELTDMMQTDTAINPGNSGGPLCNIKGEVIGINTAIIPFGQGLGFTIPIYKAKLVADQIIQHGKVQHPYMGVGMKPITDALKQELGLTDKKGALVTKVGPNTPAAKAGIEAGDVIRKIDGKAVESDSDVTKIIESKKIGGTVTVEILRNNTIKKTVQVKIGDRPEN